MGTVEVKCLVFWGGLSQANIMNRILTKIKNNIYDKCDFLLSDFRIEEESQEYGACRFELNGQKMVCRNAKMTPKKVGQFVTFWKRNRDHIIEPLHESDQIDFFLVNVELGDRLGQFVFPKSVLISKGILSTSVKEGKRGFRVYPKWDQPKSKQAIKSQAWQVAYFFEMGEEGDLETVIKLFDDIDLYNIKDKKC